MYCKQCTKEVVAIGMPPGIAPEEIEAVRRSIETEDKLVLWNPPPAPPYRCPNCGAELGADAQAT